MFPRSKWALSPLPGNGKEPDKWARSSSWKEGNCSQGNSSELVHGAATAPLRNRASLPRNPGLQEPLDTFGRGGQHPSAGNEGRF